MKRQFIVTMICLTAAVMFAGCTDSGKDDPSAFKDKLESAAEKAKEENTKEKKADKSSEDKEKKDNKKKEKPEEEIKKEDPEKLYEPVFSEIFEIMDYGYNIDKEYEFASGGLTEKINYSEGEDLSSEIGYIFEDLSGDGNEELLIGCDENYDGDRPRSYIFGIYALKDDEPVTVIAGSPRSSYQYMGKGHFFYSGSGGVAVTLIGENHLAKDGTLIEWDDFYFTDEKENGEIGIYYNDSGLFEVSGSEELKMSEDEFAGIRKKYEDRCERIPWKPIGSLKMRSGSTEAGDVSSASGVDPETQPYAGVLYWYKEMQDSGKSWEEMEEYTSRTELIQHGWPYSTNNDEIRYVYEDLTGDGYDELIITYYNDPVDIYSNEGDAVYSYGVPYRAIATLYPDGTIMEGLTLGAKGWRETWYRYDKNTYKYVPVKEKLDPEMSAIILKEGKKIEDVVIPDGLSVLD